MTDKISSVCKPIC